jgi:hypothetical protein
MTTANATQDRNELGFETFENLLREMKGNDPAYATAVETLRAANTGQAITQEAIDAAFIGFPGLSNVFPNLVTNEILAEMPTRNLFEFVAYNDDLYFDLLTLFANMDRARAGEEYDKPAVTAALQRSPAWASRFGGEFA